ncbi:MAG: 30S ribosome-binding factor RbfA [Clostridia bacterium]|nr:30S ribosome-binding factor RbfA [Clostridia bacterium]
MPNSVRMAKIDAQIQRDISSIINGLNNPELENTIISVSRVQTSADLYVCKVYLSILGDAVKKDRIMAIINNAKNYIRRELAHKTILRTVPDLVFVLDDSLDYSENINKIIDSISGEIND